MASLLCSESENVMKTLTFCGIYFKPFLSGLACIFMCFTQLILIMVWFNHLVPKKKTREICYLYFEVMCFMLCLYAHCLQQRIKSFSFVLWHYEFLYACLVSVWEWVLVLGWASQALGYLVRFQEIVLIYGDKCNGIL